MSTTKPERAGANEIPVRCRVHVRQRFSLFKHYWGYFFDTIALILSFNSNFIKQPTPKPQRNFF